MPRVSEAESKPRLYDLLPGINLIETKCSTRRERGNLSVQILRNKRRNRIADKTNARKVRYTIFTLNI